MSEDELRAELDRLQAAILAHIADIKAERERLRIAIVATLAENSHLADGDVCTLARLKEAINVR